MALFTLTNVRGKGPRGVNKASGGVKLIARGETETVDLAEGEEVGLDAYFKVRPVDAATDTPPALSGMNKADLLDQAASEGVEVEEAATKADIIAAIELAREGKAQA